VRVEFDEVRDEEEQTNADQKPYAQGRSYDGWHWALVFHADLGPLVERQGRLLFRQVPVDLVPGSCFGVLQEGHQRGVYRLVLDAFTFRDGVDETGRVVVMVVVVGWDGGVVVGGVVIVVVVVGPFCKKKN
jgi:hypothetical protein